MPPWSLLPDSPIAIDHSTRWIAYTTELSSMKHSFSKMVPRDTLRDFNRLFLQVSPSAPPDNSYLIATLTEITAQDESLIAQHFLRWPSFDYDGPSVTFCNFNRLFFQSITFNRQSTGKLQIAPLNFSLFSLSALKLLFIIITRCAISICSRASSGGISSKHNLFCTTDIWYCTLSHANFVIEWKKWSAGVWSNENAEYDKVSADFNGTLTKINLSFY